MTGAERTGRVPDAPTPPPVMAGWRDASWWNAPGRASKFHVIADNGLTARCHPRMGLIVEEAQRAADVPAHHRCRRPGCAEMWP